MARLGKLALTMMVAGGLAFAAPTAASADDDRNGAACIVCWPGWG